MKFEKLSLWHDVGFMDGSMSVPKKGSSLPTPSMIIRDGFYPSKTRLWSEVRVVKSFDDIEPMSYMRIDATYANGASATIYGWIDDVSMISDTPGHPLTSISWHIDEWRTFIDSCVFGSGTVLRRPNTSPGNLPPQPYPHRYMWVSSVDPIVENGKVWWVIVTMHYTDNGKKQISTFTSPLFKGSNTYTTLFVDKDYARGISWEQLTNGTWTSVMNIDPADVVSVFVSPFAPIDYTNGADFEFRFKKSYRTPLHKFGDTYGMMDIAGRPDRTIKVTLGNKKSTDTQRYVITGFDGETVGVVPWGTQINTVYVSCILSSTASYIRIEAGSRSWEGHLEGRCWTIPMIALDVSSNATSSYVYSGARQADLDQIKLEADKSRVNSHLNVGTSGAVGAMTGAMSGNPVAAVGGAIIGTVANTVKSEVGYRYDTGEFADRQIAINDFRASNQSEGLLISGGGYDAVINGTDISIRKLEIDTYSNTNRSADIAKWGAHVSEPIDDCSGLIAKGGGLQIANLYVGGSIPVSAKRYIKTKFANGLRMI